MGARDSSPPLQGGIISKNGATRRWRWNGRRDAMSEPLNCRREQWYLVQAHPSSAAANGDADSAMLEFVGKTGDRTRHVVELFDRGGDAEAAPRIGWVQAPPDCVFARAARSAAFRELTLQPVPERDPKCHPLAAVPRWSTCRRPFPVDSIALPPCLAGLKPLLPGVRTETIDEPRSLRDLAARVIGKAWVLDPAWIAGLRLGWSDLEKIAGGSWAVVDLETVALLHQRGKLAETSALTRSDPHGIMSARVEYYDVATCGFALMDVVPFGIYDGRFRMRVLRATRSWKEYAEERGFAMLLSSQTPRESHCNDVVSATLAIGQGEIVATDLPWIAAGAMGPPVAPRVIAALLRTHFAQPVDDRVQFWNRWDDTRVVVRDIADLARRYPRLTPVRFRGGRSDSASLGIVLSSESEASKRTLVIRTGRIDFADSHDGVPPEPMMIFMKWLARESAEKTPFARTALHDSTIVWQFDTRAGLKYATLYEAAAALPPEVQTLALTNRDIAVRRGLLGDGSQEYQLAITKMIASWIESMARS